MQTVTLERWELSIAILVGTQRTAAMAHVPDAPHYQNYSKPTVSQYTLDQLGAIAEMATAKYVGRYWSPAAWQAEEHNTMKHAYPDVMPDIEVRSVRQPHYRLVVRQTDVNNGRRIVKAQVHDTKVEPVVTLYGWAQAQYAWDNGVTSPWGDENVRLLDDTYLLDIAHLRCA
jgi:hypothetical protein